MCMKDNEEKQCNPEERARMSSKRVLLVLIPAVLIVLLLMLIMTRQKMTMNIALYSYVPDQDRFQQAVETQWEAVHPEVKLNFVSWNGYTEDPPEDLDVFVYDAVYLYDFIEKGYLLPISEEDIRDIDDFIPSALDVCSAGGITYALPQLLCTSLLYVREGDSELSDVKNVYDLYQIIGSRAKMTDPLSDGEGLLMDMPGKLTSALWYLEAQIDVKQGFSDCLQCNAV